MVLSHLRDVGTKRGAVWLRLGYDVVPSAVDRLYLSHPLTPNRFLSS
jgi:hypothetical protein